MSACVYASKEELWEDLLYFAVSPDAKRLVRKPIRWHRIAPVDRTDLAVFLACSHLAVLCLGYLWGHR